MRKRDKMRLSSPARLAYIEQCIKENSLKNKKLVEMSKVLAANIKRQWRQIKLLEMKHENLNTLIRLKEKYINRFK